MQEIISTLEHEMSKINRWERNSYFQAIEYAAWDALRQFPNDPRSEDWQWKLVYYAILAGDTGLGNETYSVLMEKALNADAETIDTLPQWFHASEFPYPDEIFPFELKTQEVVSTGQETKFLISINSFPGGSCFLVTQSLKSFSVKLLYDGFPDGGYAYVYDSLGCTLKDLTNDGNDEVIIEHYIGAHYGVSYLRVMDISNEPVRFLEFASPQIENYLAYPGLYVKGFNENRGESQMIVTYSQKTSYCWLDLEKMYEWDGNVLNLVDVNVFLESQQLEPVGCFPVVINAAKSFDLEIGTKIIDQSIEQFELVFLDKSGLEKLDELRLEKALLYLNADQVAETRNIMQDIVDYPREENSIWKDPIKSFLLLYQSPSDIYIACSELTACVPTDSDSCYLYSPCVKSAFSNLIYQNEDALLTDLVKNLQDAGVDITSSGWLDLDYDGRNELWFVVSPPNKTEASNYELWFATDYPDRVRAYSDLPEIQSINPVFHINKTMLNESFVNYDSEMNWAFIWSRDNITNEPRLRFTVYPRYEYYVDNQLFNEFNVIHEKFQTGVNDYEIYVEYMNFKAKIESLENFDCPICYFDFGYSAELVGDEKIAASMYLKVIDQYPDHPLAVLSRNKLDQ